MTLKLLRAWTYIVPSAYLNEHYNFLYHWRPTVFECFGWRSNRKGIVVTRQNENELLALYIQTIIAPCERLPLEIPWINKKKRRRRRRNMKWWEFIEPGAIVPFVLSIWMCMSVFCFDSNVEAMGIACWLAHLRAYGVYTLHIAVRVPYDDHSGCASQ